MYDAIVKWTVEFTITISVICQQYPADRWTRPTVPSEKLRAASNVRLRVKETRRLVYCNLCLTGETISNEFCSDGHLEEDSMFIEVTFSEEESSCIVKNCPV